LAQSNTVEKLKIVLDVVACPARFERATYALEAQKIDNFDSILNMLDLAKSGVV